MLRDVEGRILACHLFDTAKTDRAAMPLEAAASAD
jgi:hypothetical protein